MLALAGIRKRFGAVTALDGVDLAVRPGRIVGLLGENGAGKSTLMHVLYGLVAPDAGAIALDGAPVRIASPRDARRCGIGMVHQHFSLVPTLTALENVALGAGTGLGRIDRRAMRERLRAIAGDLGWTIDPDAVVGDLAVGQQQRLEIVKALAAGGRWLVLDEPSAVLAPQEVDELLAAMRRLAARGVGIVHITHKLAEVEAICDDVVVLRRGRVVHAGAPLPRSELARLMLGEAPGIPARGASPAPADAPVRIALRGATVAAPRGGARPLDGVDLAVRAGEIVGIAGVDGNGQDELVGVVLGTAAPTRGTVDVLGARSLLADAAARRAAGVVPGDRRREALVLDLDLRANLGLRDRAVAPRARRGWLRLGAWSRLAAELIARHGIRAPSWESSAAGLSGGNQQKVVLARELDGAPAAIVAVNPSRGLDVGAAADVFARLVAARDAGAAVLLVHGDLDELLAVADRVLVMHAGKLVDSGWPAAGRQTIGRLMLGLPADAAAGAAPAETPA